MLPSTVTLLPPAKSRFIHGGIHGTTFTPTRSAALVTASERALDRLGAKVAPCEMRSTSRHPSLEQIFGSRAELTCND